ncbi:MAG TPA: ATP-binding cassette domain-containing protein, partial [Flavisolibacter sp.]|nr:ATP-binding cassette domain-containing protein [Flavisolibacter sp.]
MIPLLQIKNLSIDFVTENRTTHAVSDISLEVNRGEIVALVGESGSGKSVTSLSLLKLLPQPPAVYAGGNLLFSDDGTTAIDLLQVPDNQMQSIRGRKIAMIFQEPMTSLNPVMRCGKQVMEALIQHKRLTATEARRQTIEWFARVQLPDPERLFDRYPHQLSGGQKQRVMIAMALCCKPSLLICDEPTTALDVTVQKAILELIKELQQELNMGVIFITHDLGVVKEIADKVAILYRGKIVEADTATALFQSPQHTYTRALIACRPALHPKGERLPVVSDFTEPGKSQNIKVKAAAKPPEQKEVLMEVTDLVVRFPVKNNIWGKPTAWFTAVDGVSLTIRKGEVAGLVGESGCGKTTLGRTLLQLIPPTSGSIQY